MSTEFGISPVIFKLVATADWHVRSGTGSELSHAMIHRVADGMGSENPDAVLFAGDMTDNGTPRSAQVVAGSLRVLTDAGIPVLAVFGNHDHSKERDPRAIARKISEKRKIYADYGGVKVIDKTDYTLEKKVNGEKRHLGVIGTTGGYDGSFYISSDENERVTLKDAGGHDLQGSLYTLQSSLHRSRFANNIILMHYAPSAVNLRGLDNYKTKYAGSNKFAAVIERYQHKLRAVFHGHTHNANRYGKIGTVDLTCVAMQVGISAARNEGRRVPTVHDFYHVQEVRCN